MKTERLTRLALLTAAALMLSWIESLLPAFSAVPGVKIGLANIAVLIALYVLGLPYAAGLAAVRIILAGLTFGGMFSMLLPISVSISQRFLTQKLSNILKNSLGKRLILRLLISFS